MRLDDDQLMQENVLVLPTLEANPISEGISLSLIQVFKFFKFYYHHYLNKFKAYNFIFKVYSTIKYDKNTLDNSLTVVLSNRDIL